MMDTETEVEYDSEEEAEAAKRFESQRSDTSVVVDNTDHSEIVEPSLIESSEVESKKSQSEKSLIERRITLGTAMREFLKGDFKQGKEYLQYVGLHKSLAERGVIPRDYYPGSLEMLEDTDRTFYAYKSIMSQFGSFIDLQNPNISGNIREELSRRIYDESLSPNEQDRKDLDKDIDDEKATSLMRADFARQENRREQAIKDDEQGFLERALERKRKADVIKKARIEEEELRVGESAKLESAYKKQLEDFSEQKKNIDAWENLITYYESIQENEELAYEKVNQIVGSTKSTEPNSEDLDFLNRWLNVHKEFGIKEMPDEEYFSFFQDGRIYAHSSSFFAQDQHNGDPNLHPVFTEALKDGFLTGSKILKARKDQTFTNYVGQRNVSFDDPDLFARKIFSDRLERDNSQIDANLHFSYGRVSKGPEYSPPVVLLTPARLLEKHSTDIIRQDQLNTALGVDKTETYGTEQKFLDGAHFGSTSRDPFDHGHEINLDIFVAVLPDMQVSPEFITGMLQNFDADSRVTEEMKAELSGLIPSPNSAEKIDFKEFMVGVQKIMKDNGFAMPRLFFYKPVDSFRDKEGYVQPENVDWVTRNGVQNFLRERQITPSGNPDQRFLHEVSPTPPVSAEIPQKIDLENIPEQFKFPQWKLEEAANRVRLLLKSNSTK